MKHTSSKKRKPRIGLALGSGAARGWSHIGVIHALHELGIKPDLVCGTSMGSLVGAFYAAGTMDDLEEWARQLRWNDVVGYMDLSMNGGLIAGHKLFEFLKQHFEDKTFEQLTMPYAAVATDMNNGAEVWLREGSVLSAARASSSIPGLFIPIEEEGRWLIDGGVVNPVPVSLCRAMGAEIVIAVDLNASRHQWKWKQQVLKEKNHKPSWWQNMLDKNEELVPEFFKRTLSEAREESPSILDVLSRSINIMQLRISRSRMAGDPPEVLIAPKLDNINLMDFHHAAEAIDAGYTATMNRLNQLEEWELVRR